MIVGERLWELGSLVRMVFAVLSTNTPYDVKMSNASGEFWRSGCDNMLLFLLS